MISLWVRPSTTTTTIDVHCDVDVSSYCIVSQKLNINEQVHFNFVNADDRNNSLVFKISSDNHIVAIPTGIFERFPHLARVYLHIGLKSVRKEDFAGASHLERVDLERNEIESIPGNLFSELKKLEDIYLSHNRIHDIEPSAFSDLEYLFRIELSNNSLTTIKRNVFSGLNSLTELTLDDNQIELIEDEALNLPKLKKLILNNNRIQTLSDTVFKHLPRLEWIILDRNGLRSIGRSLYELKNLERLDLDDNIIEDIDLDSLGRLPALTSIRLSNSGFRIENIDPELDVQYASVTHLDISKNRITATDILRRLKNFVNLKVISVADNDLTNIEDIEQVWISFPNIEHVSITKNKLTCDRVLEIYEAVERHSKFLIQEVTPRFPTYEEEGKKVHGIVCL